MKRPVIKMSNVAFWYAKTVLFIFILWAVAYLHRIGVFDSWSIIPEIVTLLILFYLLIGDLERWPK